MRATAKCGQGPETGTHVCAHTHRERKPYAITPPVAQNPTTVTEGKDLLHEVDTSLGIKSRKNPRIRKKLDT